MASFDYVYSQTAAEKVATAQWLAKIGSALFKFKHGSAPPDNFADTITNELGVFCNRDDPFHLTDFSKPF